MPRQARIQPKSTISQLSDKQVKLYRRLTTPAKVQDFLDTLNVNFEERGETCMSPLRVLQTGKAHCMEGAMLAASILRYHGYQPLAMDLRAQDPDVDHIVTPFKLGARWGAISKTNHAVLRYREPVYKNLRELALSYFHEYFDDRGRKNLREYSVPVSLSRFDSIDWETSEKDLWEIPQYLDDAKHIWIIKPRQAKHLRRAHPLEIAAGKLVEHKAPNG